MCVCVCKSTPSQDWLISNIHQDIQQTLIKININTTNSLYWIRSLSSVKSLLQETVKIRNNNHYNNNNNKYNNVFTNNNSGTNILLYMLNYIQYKIMVYVQIRATFWIRLHPEFEDLFCQAFLHITQFFELTILYWRNVLSVTLTPCRSCFLHT